MTNEARTLGHEEALYPEYETSSMNEKKKFKPVEGHTTSDTSKMKQ
jgi:hypothetical protein